MLRIIQNFQRPSKELLEGFRIIPTPTISDAMGRQNTMLHNLRPLFSNIRLVGPAFTVRTYPSDNLMCHLAIKLAEPGDIIVVSTDGYVDAGYWGEIMSSMASKKGIGGLVIEGCVRDMSAITELGFPVFCKGVIPKGTFKSHPGSINTPISCVGVSVSPGDIVVGDDDGIVIVPKEIAKLVLKKSQEVMEKEKVMKEKVEHGEILYDFLNLGKFLERPDIKWI